MDFGPSVSLEFRFRKQTDKPLGSLIKAMVFLIISTSFHLLKNCTLVLKIVILYCYRGISHLLSYAKWWVGGEGLSLKDRFPLCKKIAVSLVPKEASPVHFLFSL